jgi:hypothetical protein
MKWFDLANIYRYSNNRALALLMSQMWFAAANSGDDGLLSNLSMNQMDAFGIASALDYSGVQVPDGVQTSVERW